MADTLRPQWPAELIEKAAAIRLLALDVDGIMTDGTLLFSASGDEMKGSTFSTAWASNRLWLLASTLPSLPDGARR